MNNYDYPLTGSLTQFMYRVYGWMAAGLVLTAGVAYYIASSPTLFQAIVTNRWLLWGILLAQIGLVLFLSLRIIQMSYSTAVAAFLGYSILNGLTFSAIFMIYSLASIYTAFAVTAGMFGIMALYGYFTRSDLSSFGNILLMGLFGLIIAMVINIFWKNQMFDILISLAGVVIFTVLVAYDTQRIKQIGYTLISQGQSAAKVSIIGALSLYLDFINLFLFILRFLGRRRD